MRRPRAGGGLAAALMALMALSVCGGAARPDRVAVAHPPPVSRPAGQPTPPAGPAPSPPTAGATFAGTVVRSPGAPVRFGPGMDMPVMDVLAAGSTEVFDGWFQRAGDAPQPDAITGRIEAWSRDWFHLADGRGWVSSASVRGFQPPGAAQSAWTRPASLPGPAAIVLDVPLHLQDQPVTCEVAALEMALASRGIDTDERSLLALTGVDSRPPVEDGSGNILEWADPNAVFVGDPAGQVLDHTGYGVYAAPIARAAVRSGASVLASGPGTTAPAVYSAVMGGHPVVAWVTNDYQTELLRTWRAWDGAQVQYTFREHAALVVGVTPALVLLNDPYFGQRWHPRAEFEAAYATFGDMAVIVA
jgi:uncharacterized protein YvpB